MRVVFFALVTTIASSVDSLAVDNISSQQTSIDDKPACGITVDVMLSACRKLLDNLVAFFDWDPIYYNGLSTAWRHACMWQ
jgi:hypothetical protein